MATHINKKSVTFKRPFVLEGFKSAQPAGTYTVGEVVVVDDRGRTVRRTYTFIEIDRGRGAMRVMVDPADLQDALERDSRSGTAIF